MNNYKILVFALVFGLFTTSIFAQVKSEENETKPCFQEKAEKQEAINKAETNPFRINRIIFSGNTFTSDRKLRKKMAFEQGDIFEEKLFEKSLVNLSKSKYIFPIDIENVKISINRVDGTIDMTFCVEERRKK